MSWLIAASFAVFFPVESCLLTSLLSQPILSWPEILQDGVHSNLKIHHLFLMIDLNIPLVMIWSNQEQ